MRTAEADAAYSLLALALTWTLLGHALLGAMRVHRVRDTVWVAWHMASILASGCLGSAVATRMVWMAWHSTRVRQWTASSRG